MDYDEPTPLMHNVNGVENFMGTQTAHKNEDGSVTVNLVFVEQYQPLVDQGRLVLSWYPDLSLPKFERIDIHKLHDKAGSDAATS